MYDIRMLSLLGAASSDHGSGCTMTRSDRQVDAALSSSIPLASIPSASGQSSVIIGITCNLSSKVGASEHKKMLLSNR